METSCFIYRLLPKGAFQRKFFCSILSALLFALPWFGCGPYSLFVAFIPLLIVSGENDGTKKGCWNTFRWALLTFVLWNILTVWWVWNATPAGPIAATIVSSGWNIAAFMIFHFFSKRFSAFVKYTALVTSWIAYEYLYLITPAMSFPWLLLGHGFVHATPLVQWYEYTGVLGGSLWILIVNIFLFEALQKGGKRLWTISLASILLPAIASLYLLFSYEDKPVGEVVVSAVQPNVDCYEKFSGDSKVQQKHLVELIGEVSGESDYVLVPETALAEVIKEDDPNDARIIRQISEVLSASENDPRVISGAETMKMYKYSDKTSTARHYGNIYYDIFNSSLDIDKNGVKNIHHKTRMVIGVEIMPAWFRFISNNFVDLGGTVGQLGIDNSVVPFVNKKAKITPAICYEGLYGQTMADFVRNGAQIQFIVSNDGWWGDTPGYRYLFAYCKLRAIETRRYVARSANTGISGFISSKGEVISSLGWDKEGTITQKLPLLDNLTVYARMGDYLGRISLYIVFLLLIYFIAYWAKKKSYLE